MSETLFATFSSTLKRSALEDISRTLGESEQAVSRGFELASAAVFGGLMRKAGDTDAMRQTIDLGSKAPINAISSALSGDQLINPNSTLMSGGKRFLSFLFGGGQDAILGSIGRESGLRAGAASSLLALAAQSVLSFIGSRVREGGMTATSLSNFLQSEGADLRNSLPKGFDEALRVPVPSGRVVEPVIAQTIETNPVVAQSVRKERSILPWLLPLLAVLLGLIWYFARPKPRVAEVPPAPVNEAPAPAPATPNLGAFVQRQLPDGAMLRIPENGVEGRLLAFIRDTSKVPDKTTWFDFDRLLFDTGSATLQPQSQEQLGNIAAILKAYPNVHLKIGGYTDNVGSADQNPKLSQDRATNVMNELIRLGISSDRLTAQGYGEDHPVGDNSTEAGRAQNRRISMLVTQK